MKNRRKSEYRLASLGLERLECRFALSGVVTITEGANLKVEGDNLSNDISITLVGEQWQIVGNGDTTLRTKVGSTLTDVGQLLLVAKPTGNVDILTGFSDVDNDVVDKFHKSGNETADVVNLAGLEVLKNLTISGKNGGDVDLTAVNVTGKTAITFGGGKSRPGVGSDVSISGGLFGPQPSVKAAGKDLVITTGNQFDVINLSSLDVGGKLTVSTGFSDPDSDAVDPKHTNGNETADEVSMTGLTIGGNLTISGKSGGDLKLEGSSVTGKTAISFARGGTEEGFGSVVSIEGGVFGPTPAGKTTGGKDLIIDITKGLQEDDVELIDVTVGGKLSVKTGIGNDFISVEGGSFTGDALIDGGTKRSGTDSIQVGGIETLTQFIGRLFIKLGNGDAEFESDLGGNVDFFGKLLPDSSRTITVGKDLAITGASKLDTVALAGVDVGGRLTVATGAGDDTITVEDLRVAGDVTIDAGRVAVGADTVQVSSTVGGATSFGKKLTINLGKGSSETGIGFVDISGVQAAGPTFSVTVGGDLSIATGGTDDLVALSGTGIGGKLTVATGAGNDFISVENMGVAGDTTLDAGKTAAGADVVQVTTVGGTSSFAKKLTISLGKGEFEGDTGVVDIAGEQTAGTTNSITVGGNLSIATGGTDDEVDVVGVSAGGKLTIATGVGSDSINLTGVNVANTTLIDAGFGKVGTDTVFIGEDSVQVQLQQLVDPPPPRTTTLGGIVTVKLGNGIENGRSTLAVVGDLSAGDATIDSTSNTTVGGLAVTGGRGSDGIIVKGVAIRGNFVVKTGAGDDMIVAHDVVVGVPGNDKVGNLIIDGQDGNDVIAIGMLPSSRALNSFIAGVATITGGRHQDTISSQNTSFAKLVTVNIADGQATDVVLASNNSFAPLQTSTGVFANVKIKGDAKLGGDKLAAIGNDPGFDSNSLLNLNFVPDLLDQGEVDIVMAAIFSRGHGFFPDYIPAAPPI